MYIDQHIALDSGGNNWVKSFATNYSTHEIMFEEVRYLFLVYIYKDN